MGRRRIVVSAAVTVVAAMFLFAHLRWPSIQIDTATVALLIIMITPWLADVFKSIKLLGLEFVLQEMRAKTDEAHGAAISAGQKADVALAGVAAPAPAASPFSEERRAELSEERLIELTKRYNEIRASQGPGPLRTTNMTRLVRDMITLAPSLKLFDARSALHDTDAGRRLAAYSYLYAKPLPELLPDLLEALTRLEDKPFGQYWGIQAMGRILAEMRPTDVPGPIHDAIEAFAERFQRSEPGTDRAYELGRILKQFRSEQR